MTGIVAYLTRANLPVLLFLIFAGHAALYLILGTGTWFTTALLATAFYGMVIAAIRYVFGRTRVK